MPGRRCSAVLCDRLRTPGQLGDCSIVGARRSVCRRQQEGLPGVVLTPTLILTPHVAQVVGNGRCPIVDTWWQTETGAHMITPLPGATELKPGSATLPFFGVEPAVLNEKGEELQGECEGCAALRARRAAAGVRALARS